MKRIGITQRVEVSVHGERRDCLDQRWQDIAAHLGCLLVPLSNVAPWSTDELVDTFQLQAVILSGGNDPVPMNPTVRNPAPERDAFETSLLEVCSRRELPVVGICRGMQFINLHFGGLCSPITGHVAVEHALVAEPTYPGRLPQSVNSYHNFGIDQSDLGSGLIALAFDTHGHVEAFKHERSRIAAIMWHPERESPLRLPDIDLLRSFLE